MAKKPSNVKLGKNDKLDFEPALQQARTDERALTENYKKWTEEFAAIEQEQVPERWGEYRRLTLATPGHLLSDPTYIPEVVELRDGTRRRVCKHVYIDGQLRFLSPDSTQKLRWALNDPRKLAIYKSHGWRMVSFNKTFEGSGYFETNVQDWTINGDLVLVTISIDGWERQREEIRKRRAAMEGEEASASELFEVGRQTGTPTFVDDLKRGVRNYYTAWLIGLPAWYALQTLAG